MLRWVKEGGQQWDVLLRWIEGLKVNAGKSKVIVLGREEGLECEVCMDGVRLEYALEFILFEFCFSIQSAVKDEDPLSV